MSYASILQFFIELMINISIRLPAINSKLIYTNQNHSAHSSVH